jgi:hypothetical protein
VLGAAKADTSLNEKVGNGEDRDNDKPKQTVHPGLRLQEIFLFFCYRKFLFS